MYRAVLPEGTIHCAAYERDDDGVELYDDDGSFVAFVPYASLEALVDEEVYATDERSIM